MSGIIHYDKDIVECSVCGEENIVNTISEYDVDSGETFNSIVAGQKCNGCKNILTDF